MPGPALTSSPPTMAPENDSSPPSQDGGKATRATVAKLRLTPVTVANRTPPMAMIPAMAHDRPKTRGTLMPTPWPARGLPT